MKLSYEVFVRHEVYQILQRIGADDRERFCDFVESLADDPFRTGDATTSDDTGRVVQAKVLGRFVLFYWADHAAKEVRVVDLSHAAG
jgi:mRNA-degrading endonuclease RelE of RelBE toxin-antitoxin system